MRIQTKCYRKWTSMLRRCSDPNHPAYSYYGERGISVCFRWQGVEGFKNFLADMGEPPEGLTLERIDNSKGYYPDNCRWATWGEQAKNRRPGGPPIDKNSLRQKAIAAGLPYSVVYGRIKKLRWTEKRALNTTKIARTGKKSESTEQQQVIEKTTN